MQSQSPLSWLHIAKVVATQAAERGFRRLGLFGTRWLLDSEVYAEKLAARGLQFVRPDRAERDQTNRIIVDELVNGIATAGAVAYHQQVMGRMKDQGCDAVISAAPKSR